MIIFKTIKGKNFLSIGDNPVEISLNQAKTTLITGHNGAGKSTLISMLSFVLFGKTDRNINTPQVINSINRKDCLVELTFSVNSKEYKILRGLKPNIFEIYENGKLIDETTSKKDYQKFLEQNILKMNQKVFNQIVVLSSTQFIPFMQLSANDKRMVIEELLDIQVFSTMTLLLKEKAQKIKEDILDISSKKTILTETKKILEKSKEDSDRNKEDIQKKFLEENKKTLQEMKDVSDTLETLQENLSKVSEEIIEAQSDAIFDDIDKIKKAEILLKQKENTLKKESNFFDKNDICHTCQQAIDLQYKSKKIMQINDDLEKISTQTSQIIKKLQKHDFFLLKIKELQSTKNDLQNKIQQKLFEQKTLQKSLENIEKSLQDLTFIDNENVTKEIEEKQKELEEIEKQIVNIKKNQELFNISSVILKDSGIKTSIIKKYVPLINKYIAHYLTEFGFNVQFEFNNELTETIKTKFRENFSYDSFSEGEKTRIDLSIMFTWREISKMRNSLSTNLLIFDEILDSSLSSEGIDTFLRIINKFSNQNIFVISHRGEDGLHQFFEKNIEVSKNNGFSKYQIF